MLEVDALQTKEVKVELTDWVVKNIIIEQFCDLFDIEMKSYIEDGNLMLDRVNSNVASSYTTPEKVREASEEDIAAVLVLAKIVKEL